MKYFILIFSVMAASPFGENFSTLELQSLWNQGETGKQEVLEIAETRLANNSDDIVGLLLKFEYEVAYERDLDEITRLGTKIKKVGKKIDSENFSKSFQLLSSSIDLVNIHIRDLKSGRAKHLVRPVEKTHQSKYMIVLGYLKAYEQDLANQSTKKIHEDGDAGEQGRDLSHIYKLLGILVLVSIVFGFLYFRKDRKT